MSNEFVFVRACYMLAAVSTRDRPQGGNLLFNPKSGPYWISKTTIEARSRSPRAEEVRVPTEAALPEVLPNGHSDEEIPRLPPKKPLS
jgi:hypothetical protein